MNEKPILFNAEMVNAILSGRKTQTRRIMRDQPEVIPPEDECGVPGYWIPYNAGKTMVRNEMMTITCPLGAVGDQLWVRECFRVHSRATDVATLVYRASERNSWTEQTRRVPVSDCNRPVSPEKWTPAIHMPRWASRINLLITGVRVERLNDISDADAMSEGIDADRLAESQDHYDCIADHNMTGRPTAKGYFSSLWQSIYGEENWEANPWVWVIEFERMEAK
ncbi:TPA: hypothetical protein ACPZNJ_004524 [Yersinia enterocolitica]